MVLSFDKYEGLGNDFVVIEGESLPSLSEVRGLCDRHFGVGADGVLVVGAAGSSGVRARMTVLNADGSRPEMCGNGLRCVALHLSRRDGARHAEYQISTDAGVLSCVVDREEDTGQVLVELGRATPVGELLVPFEGQELCFRQISVGNPHAVLFDHRFDTVLIDRLSPSVSGAIPGESNVEYVVASPDGGFDLVVWERGVGRTLACGTGAGATVAALALAGRAPYDEAVRVRLPGGELQVAVARETLAIRLKGPARRVFTGELAAEILSNR